MNTCPSCGGELIVMHDQYPVEKICVDCEKRVIEDNYTLQNPR